MVVLLAGCRLEPNPRFDEALAAATTDGTATTTGGTGGTGATTGASGSSGTDATGDGPSSSGVDSTDGGVEGCYDGVVTPGALCFEYRLVTAGAGQDAPCIAAGDFDGDRNPDILVGNFGTARVLFGDGTGSFWGEFTLAPSKQAGFASPLDAAALDLDDDGLDDAVMVWSESNTVDVLLTSAEGGFEPAVPYTIEGSPSRVVAADFDDDGNVDLAVSSVTGNAVTILYGLGGGSFLPGAPMDAGVAPGSLTATDLDANGLVDIAVAAEGALQLLFNTGDRVFALARPFELPTPVTVMFADLDLDEVDDLFVSNADQQNFVLYGLPDGGFVEADTWWNWTGRVAYSAAAGDFNADGLRDVAWAEGFMGNGSMTWMLGVGDRVFETTLNPLFTFPQDLAVADMNHDGVDDVLLANVGSTLGAGMLLSVP